MDFNYFCIFRNRNEYSTKLIQSVSLQPICVSTLPDKTKMAQKQPTAYCSALCLFSFKFFSRFLENSVNIFLTEKSFIFSPVLSQLYL